MHPMTSPPTSPQSEPALADLLAAFSDHASPLGVRVERLPTVSAAGAIVAVLAKELAAPRAILSTELRDAAPQLTSALDAAGLDWTAAGDVATTRDAPLGLSLAHLAVAETASVLLAEPTLTDRAVGLAVALQIVLCPTAALVSSLADAIPALRTVAARPGGGYATLVTGPSRTADIELSLTIGVQGPARVAVLFVDELA